jgi:hypothetical protein
VPRCLAFTLGTVFSLGRMMQGAHFLAQRTAIFCWLISLGSYYCILYRPAMKAQREASTEPVAPETTPSQARRAPHRITLHLYKRGQPAVVATRSTESPT